jgi:hypothetical protein
MLCGLFNFERITWCYIPEDKTLQKQLTFLCIKTSLHTFRNIH